MIFVSDPLTKRIVSFIKYQSPALLWGLFICLLLLLPIGNVDNNLVFGFIQADKIVHIVLFSFFALLTRVGWAKWYRNDFFAKKANIWTILEGFALAIITEGLQYYTSYRSFSSYDILADMMGVFLGLVLFLLIYKL